MCRLRIAVCDHPVRTLLGVNTTGRLGRLVFGPESDGLAPAAEGLGTRIPPRGPVNPVPHSLLFLPARRHPFPPKTLLAHRRIVWSPAGGVPASARVSVDFPQLAMHAIARASEAFPRDCIYTHVEGGGTSVGLPPQGDPEGEGGGEEEDGCVVEMRLVPADAGVHRMGSAKRRPFY